MSKKKKDKVLSDNQILDIAVNNSSAMMQYVDDLNSNPEYSLEVDPTNKYGLNESYKQFIKNYVDFKNVAVAANLSGLSPEEAKTFFNSYSFKMEVDRLSKAKVQRRFMTKPLSIMQMIGYLESLITEENVSEHEKISSMDKVKVIQVLISLRDAARHEEAIDMNSIDIDERLKALSIDSIKRLLESDESVDEMASKENLIEELCKDKDLSPDEIAYLKSLSSKELLDVLDQIKKMVKK